MDRTNIPQIRARMVQAARKKTAWIARTSLTVRVMLGLFFVAAVLTGLHGALTKTAILQLTVQHSFRSANISVWIDGDLAFRGKLSGSVRKKFGLIPSAMQGSLSTVVPVVSGT